MNTGFSIKAVIIGWLVDIVGSSILAGIVGVVLGIVLASRGSSPEQIREMVTNSTAMGVAGLALGLVLSGVGGYLAARIAGFDEMKHAISMGVLSELTGIVTVLVVPHAVSQPGWYNACAFLLTIPVAAAGGYLRKQQVSG